MTALKHCYLLFRYLLLRQLLYLEIFYSCLVSSDRDSIFFNIRKFIGICIIISNSCSYFFCFIIRFFEIVAELIEFVLLNRINRICLWVNEHKHIFWKFWIRTADSSFIIRICLFETLNSWEKMSMFYGFYLYPLHFCYFAYSKLQFGL